MERKFVSAEILYYNDIITIKEPTMKKNLIAILVAVSLAGCATLGTVIDGAAGAVSSLEQSTLEAMEMAPAMEFGLFYAAYFFLGGYGFGDDNFKEGEGVRWRIANDDSGEDIVVTRALLKTNGDGSAWWFLEADADDEVHFYEMLLSENYDVLKVRYKDRESGTIEEYIPEPGEETDEEELEEMEPDYYKEYSVGEEQVKTEAGSFKAEHLVFQDEEEQFKSDYWLAERVPGRIVKYIYNNMAEGEIVSGEVIDIRGGYRTQLSSY